MVYGLGEKLAAKRKERRLSQRTVAAAINVSPSVISNYEKGERTPSVETLMSLASLYHCKIDYLVGMETAEDLFIDTSMLNRSERAALTGFLAEMQKRLK